MSFLPDVRPRSQLSLAGLVALGLLALGTPLGAGVSQAATGDLRSTVDFGAVVQRTAPSALGFGSSTYGANPLSSTVQNDAERRLDARSVRLPVGFRNGRVPSSAAGGPTTLDIPALVQRYRSWGYRVLVVIGGRTNDTDVAPGDATQIIRALGVNADIDYSAPNEPNNRGLTLQSQIDAARLIVREGKALNAGFTLWGPVWSYYNRATMKTFAAGMGADLGGIDYHHYAMGSTSISTADALRSTPLYGQEVQEVKADLAGLGRQVPVNVDELNFSWRYQDGTPGGNNRFFTAVNTVWMTSALGHILKAGGRGMPYASQNGPLGIMVQAGNVNPDNRPASSPMPAFWGIAAWTGAQVWPHYKDAVYSASSDDPTGEVFAVNNEAGGYNVIAINKSEADAKRLSLTLRNLPSGSYTAYQTNPVAPYDQPIRIADGSYSAAAMTALTLPRMSVTVVVVKPGASTPSPAPSPTAAPTPSPSVSAAPVVSTPSVPRSLISTDSADRSQTSVSWQPPSSDGGTVVTGYRVARDGIDAAGVGPASTILPATARSFVFSSLRPDPAYTFSVQAVNAAGTGGAAVVTRAANASALTAPTAVQGVRNAAGTQISLSWQPPSADGGTPVTGYRVTRDGSDSTGGGTYSTVVPATARNFGFSLLNPSANYQLTVQAVTATSSGPVAAVTSPARVVTTVPSPPMSVSIGRDSTGTRVTIGWQPPQTDGGSAVTGYRITRNGSDSTGGGAYSTVVAASMRTFTMTLLQAATPYTLTVSAINAVGTGPATGASSPAS